MEPEETAFVPDLENFQTPPYLCNYMAAMLKGAVPPDALVVEPTPGAGNMVQALQNHGFTHIESPPGDFFQWLPSARPVAIIGNPPWSPMTLAYEILFRCLDSGPDIVIMVMPWMTLLNSDSRIQELRKRGLDRIIGLPRSVFPGIRAGCCILVFQPKQGKVPDHPTAFPTKDHLLGFSE